ncbi:hypothetical protein PMZ80_001305 [Knufia obscura]|uniref:Uncharacterized protein n=2 Tax=Knufia TaxID=430999 RepID=A0AAN8EQG4_9EURO|nr:hypothetical protein PMZ80_001305 [Knufia obscura]KAK5956292.1 hypothetical protein OHC33_002868 [Knufia fluminis]
MAAVDRASARLRKTFKYPSDDEGSDGSRDELDEEEQESLLTTLQTKSAISNKTYTLIFTTLPLTLTPLFTYHLLVSATTPARLRLLCLLSLTSLLASSFTMFFLSNIDTTDARARLNTRQRQMNRATFSAPPHATALLNILTKLLDKMDDMRLDLDSEGPLLQALPVLNGVMCGLLALASLILRGQSLRGVNGLMWMYLLLPGVMAGMTTVARWSIMEEQRGLRELGGLRYGYKGA